MKYLIAITLGYLIGSINPAYIIGKLKGFDIRERGSHNAGASNAKICLGWKYFFIVAIFDISKSLLAAIIAHYFIANDILITTLAGCFAIIGHCFPFYLDFQGGKGFAAYIGLSLFIDWKLFIILMAIFLIIAYLLNYIVIATFSLAIAVPYVAYRQQLPMTCLICFIFISMLIFFQHRSNFIRFFRKEEIGINGKLIGIRFGKQPK